MRQDGGQSRLRWFRRSGSQFFCFLVVDIIESEFEFKYFSGENFKGIQVKESALMTY